jgi:hypothetical protein
MSCNPVPTTYKDLANDKLASRVMLADITGGGGLANFSGIVYASGGDTSNVKPGLDLIGHVKPEAKVPASSGGTPFDTAKLR